MGFHIASEQEIRAGKVTDVYFTRAKQVLQAKRIHKKVVAEFVVKKFPDAYPWGVFAGLEEALELLADLPVKVRAMREGTLFREWEPVLEIEGDYLDFGIYETALLGFLCQASGIATKAARCRQLAGDRTLISFGARRMHPAIAPMVERAAYIGGCDGVTTVKTAELLGLAPTGTMPHALILLVGDTVKTIEAFDKVIEPKVRRIALIDTFNDEKFEALRVADALGKKLYAIRLDTPSSRRGDFLAILKEVRWELDLRGYKDVKLFVSGGIAEQDIQHLNEAADAYGIGTALSNAPVLDYAMDIVEIAGKPIAKRGKHSGRKQVWRCEKCVTSVVLALSDRSPNASKCRCGATREVLLYPPPKPHELPKPTQIRQWVLSQLSNVGRSLTTDRNEFDKISQSRYT